MIDNKVSIKITAEANGVKIAAKEASDAIRKVGDQSLASATTATGGWAAVSNMFRDLAGTIASNVGQSSSALSGFGGIAKTAADDAASGAAGYAALAGRIALVGTAAVGAGTLLAKFAAQSAAYTLDAISLGRAMGVSATQAAVWGTALADVGATQGELIAASRGLTMKVKENEDGLNALGVVTRDVSGNLLQMDGLMLNAITTVNAYKSGTDRGAAAAEIFGRSVDSSSMLLLANAKTIADNTALMDKFGIKVGQESVEDWAAFDAAMDSAGLGLRGIGLTIGNAMIPVITMLANALSDILPAAIIVTRGAIGGLLTAFYGLRSGIVIIFTGLKLAFDTLAISVLTLGAVVQRALALDFSGAKAAWETGFGALKTINDKALNDILADAKFTSAKIANLFLPQTDSAAPSVAGRAFVKPEDPGKPEKPAKPAKPEKLSSPKLDDDARRSLDDEIANLDALSSAREKMEKSSRDAAAITANALTESRLSAVEAMKAQVQLEREIGAISARDSLEQFRALEEAKLVILLQANADKKALLPADDLAALAQNNAEREALMRQHAASLQGIIGSGLKLDAALFSQILDPIASAFEKTINGVIAGTVKFKDAFKNIGRSIMLEFSSMMVKMGIDWVKQEALRTAATATGATARTGIEAGAALKSVLIATAAGIKKIAIYAYEAAAAAFVAVAAIPIVGPVLAVVAAGAALAFVGGLASRIGGGGGGGGMPSGGAVAASSQPGQQESFPEAGGRQQPAINNIYIQGDLIDHGELARRLRLENIYLNDYDKT